MPVLKVYRKKLINRRLYNSIFPVKIFAFKLTQLVYKKIISLIHIHLTYVFNYFVKSEYQRFKNIYMYKSLLKSIVLTLSKIKAM